MKTRFWMTGLLVLILAPLGVIPDAWAAPPGGGKIGGQKVLTLISRDPPGVRCNNNMQVAAELSNIYRIPVQIIPHALAGQGAKAPAVYWGDELLAADGGAGNGMTSFAELQAIMDVEGVATHASSGRLIEIKPKHDALKEAIKNVK